MFIEDLYIKKICNHHYINIQCSQKRKIIDHRIQFDVFKNITYSFEFCTILNTFFFFHMMLSETNLYV